MPWVRKIVVIAAAAIGLVVGIADAASRPAGRPETWAQPVTLAGVPNLYRVSADLYRSGQLTLLGMGNLQALGVKTIVNLRSFHSDRDEICQTPLAYEQIFMKTWHPEEKEVVRFLKIATDPQRTPVLVHCQYGSDRTGAMVAVYRIAVQGWTKAEALREMTQGGYGFHSTWENLLEWIQCLDIEDIKKQAGIKSPPVTTE